MQPAQARYGRPKDSGLDDRQQLESIAALLVANPKLKPTTAIRSLGVENPSTVRRLRDKFRLEQSSLMAEARLAEVRSRLPGAINENTPAAERAPANRIEKQNERVEHAPTLMVAMFSSWCDLGFAALSCTVRAQAAAAQFWLGLPPVAAATRGQLAAGSVAVAVIRRSRGRAKSLH
jgi:hypothetical protein